MATNQLYGDAIFEGSTVSLVERKDMFGNNVKRLIIEGTAIKCNVPGINNRAYPKPIIEREANRLVKDFVMKGRLAASLNHPRLGPDGTAKDYPIFEMDLMSICALIEDLHMEGDLLKVRMVVMEETVAGKQLAALIRGGYHPGFSLRGAGSTINMGEHEEIADDYTMITIDVVGNPSFGQDAIFTARQESAEGKAKALTESVAGPRPLVESVTDIMNRYGAEIAHHYATISVGGGLYDKNGLISALRGFNP
jgi:hypothetical protein